MPKKKKASKQRFFQVGDTVRLRWGKRKAVIELFYGDVEGGIRLDRKLGGFWSWNVNDLVLVKPCPFGRIDAS